MTETTVVRTPRIASLSPSVTWGFIAAGLIAVGSFGGGATRYRGGIVSALGLDWIAFGHGFAIFEIMIWLGLALLVFSWLIVGRQAVFSTTTTTTSVAPAVTSAATDGAALRTLNATLLAWLIPLSLSGPLFSRDVYSYLMQGAMMRDGFDPYTEGAAVNPGPMLMEVSADWRNTTTPYGPLHLGIGEVITRIVGDNIALGVAFYRILCLAGFLAIWWSIPRITRALGGSPVLALWLGVLNPLVVLHLIAGLHNEALMVGLVSLALVAALELPRIRGGIVAAVVLGIAVSLKATAVIALPFVVWIVLTRKNHLGPAKDLLRRAPELLGVGVALVTVTLATLAAITWITGSTWGWISEISGNTKVINPLALPSAVAGVIAAVMAWINDDITFNLIVYYTRRVSAVLMLVGLVLTWLLFRHNPRRNIAGVVVAYIVACVLNAVALPWYYASLLTPMGTIRPPQWAIQGTVLFTLILSLSFAGGGNHRFYEVPWMLAITLAAWFATGWVVNGRLSWSYPWRSNTQEPSSR